MDESDFTDILEAVRGYVREVVLPAEEIIEETDAIPAGIRTGAADLGIFGYALPEQYGGLGVTAVQDVRLAIELGYTSPAFRSMFGTNNGIAGQVLVAFGTPRQKEEFLPPMARGDCVASFALTEPEAGSDPSGLRTSAVRDGDDYVINGAKRFITNANWSDILLVFARTGGPGPAGISVFVVDTDSPGVTVGPRDRKMGQRGSTTAGSSSPTYGFPPPGSSARWRTPATAPPCGPWSRGGSTSRAAASAWPSGSWTRAPATRPRPGRAAPSSASSSRCRRCSPTRRPR